MSPTSATFLIGSFSAMCAAVSTGCTLFNVLRTGRSVKSKEAKALSDRIDAAQRTADGWHESNHAQVMEAAINKHSTLINSLQERLENVATKTELTRVEGSIDAVDAILQDVKGGVDRIESMLMHKALNA